jgi:hypothetical protein
MPHRDLSRVEAIIGEALHPVVAPAGLLLLPVEWRRLETALVTEGFRLGYLVTLHRAGPWGGEDTLEVRRLVRGTDE